MEPEAQGTPHMPVFSDICIGGDFFQIRASFQKFGALYTEKNIVSRHLSLVKDRVFSQPAIPARPTTTFSFIFLALVVGCPLTIPCVRLKQLPFYQGLSATRFLADAPRDSALLKFGVWHHLTSLILWHRGADESLRNRDIPGEHAGWAVPQMGHEWQ